MNIVEKVEFNFQGISLQSVEGVDGVWFTSNQIAYALRYSDDKAVQRIFTRHDDEFTDKMTRVVKLTTPGGCQSVRIFSLRGTHLIAMFSRTDVAKEFRHWILNILDQECVGASEQCAPAVTEKRYPLNLTSSELCSIVWLYKASRHMREELEVLAPKLAVLRSPYADSTSTLSSHYKHLLHDVKELLSREVSKIDRDELIGRLNWGKALQELNLH